MAAAPAVILAVLYVPSLGAAYRLDDLAWLSLPNTLRNGHSIWWVLFSPQAQGSIRPLGERLWFLLASWLFGLNPLPLHLLALATQMANAVLVAAAGRRLLGSATAAGIAAALWVLNDSLVEPMVWASAYNEVLYTFWFLLAFLALMRWVDTGKVAWMGVHIAAMALGFATNELMVVFPMIAVVWVDLFAHRRWRAVVPSAALTAIFVTAHLLVARLPGEGPYKMSFDRGMVGNLAHYWASVLGPEEYRRIHGTGAGITIAGTVLISVAALWWATRRRTGWFGVLWFVLGLIPVLPLSAHVTPYYTFLPLIGLAWLAGDALVRVRWWPGRSLAVVCVVLYVICEIPSTVFVRDWYRDRSAETEARERRMGEAVRRIRRVQPQGPVFLTGIDSDQFWWGLCYGELVRRGFGDLHIPADGGRRDFAVPPREWCLARDFEMPVGTGSGGVFDVSAMR